MLTLLAAIALAPKAFGPINDIPLPPSADSFDFVALGDNRPTGKGLPPTDIFKSILTEVKTIHPAFVLSSGDLVYGNEEPLEMYKHELDEVQSLVKDLGVPFYNSPGNHETANRPELEQEYVSRFGAPYGTFKYGGWNFLAVSTDLCEAPEAISPAQWQSLENWGKDAGPTFAYMHHPVFGRKTNSEKDNTVKDHDRIHEFFKAHNVKAVFEGHDHVFNYQQHDGVDYYITGGAGAPLDAAPQDGGFNHFLLVHVEGQSYTVNVVPANTLVIRKVEGGWAVSNYSDCDLPLRGLALWSDSKPSAVNATVDKKGKGSPVEASITSSNEVGGKWAVRVSLIAAKHRTTTVNFP